MPFEDLAFLFTCGRESRGICRLDFDEAALLYKTVRGLRQSGSRGARGVEIGRYHGGSTLLLADAVGMGGLVTSIDIHKGNAKRAEALLKRVRLLVRARIVVGDSKEVKGPRHELDFVFIDGDHSYEGVKADQDKWGAFVRPGGMVIHHDMTPSPTPGRNGPQRVFHELMEGDEFEFVASASSLVVFEKKERE